MTCVRPGSTQLFRRVWKRYLSSGCAERDAGADALPCTGIKVIWICVLEQTSLRETNAVSIFDMFQ